MSNSSSTEKARKVMWSEHARLKKEWSEQEDRLIALIAKTDNAELMEAFLEWQRTRATINELGLLINKTFPKWEVMDINSMPTMNDLPFLTRQKVGKRYDYELWDDTDWFDEVFDRDKLQRDHWHRLEPKPKSK